MKKAYFQIVRNVPMSDAGYRHWNDRRIIPVVFKPEVIPELKAGIDANLINSKDKLCDYLWHVCGEGTYDLRILMRNKKSKTKRASCTFVRITLNQVDDLGVKYVCSKFDTQGLRNKFGFRFGVWKRMVDWEDEF